jgi:hypothetical protein
MTKTSLPIGETPRFPSVCLLLEDLFRAFEVVHLRRCRVLNRCLSIAFEVIVRLRQ